MTALAPVLAGRIARFRRVVVAVALAGSALLGVSPARAAIGVPFSDPRQVGTIGFCNPAGDQITHGSVSATPFAWRAVSTVAAKAPYDGRGRTATLFAYQPRKGLAAGEWSGEELTAAADYTNTSHPMTAATRKDYPLKVFVQDFPPQWDGLVQIRMYLGAPNEPPASLSYPAAVLKVTGNTWHVVSGGSVDCASGKAVSVETLLTTPATAHHQPAGGSNSTATTHPGKGPQPSGAKASGPSSAASPAAATAGSGHSSGPGAAAIAAIVIGGVIALVLAFLVLLRRRRRVPATAPAPRAPVDITSTKGR